ncbi:MAG: hypothetical protein AB7O52_10485 [Planctomycetota bacterium]
MKIVPLYVMLGLAFLTDMVFSPLLRIGLAQPDVPLLFLVFLAQRDRRPRIYLTLISIACVRSALGPDQLPLAWIPLALAAELQQLFRLSVHLRDPWRRLPVMAIGVGATVCFRAYLQSWLPAGVLVQVGLQSALLGVMLGAVLFPIWDLATPLLRSHRYPL